MTVWLGLDQAALDAAYDQTAYAPNFRQVVSRMEALSGAARASLGEPQVHRYGPEGIQRLYFYPAPAPGAPLHIHVHGGAWRQRLAETLLFPAEMFVRAGIGFAILDFTSVDDTGGDLRPMLSQVFDGLAWFARSAAGLGGDPNRLFLSGFSSGAHLAGAALIANWATQGFKANPFRGALLASGMYDLRPVRLSSRSRYVAFDDELEHDMSTLRHVLRYTVPTILVNGDHETPEFQRQTVEFARALSEQCRLTDHIVAAGYNHYEVMEMFSSPYSPLGRAVLMQNMR